VQLYATSQLSETHSYMIKKGKNKCRNYKDYHAKYCFQTASSSSIRELLL